MNHNSTKISHYAHNTYIAYVHNTSMQNSDALKMDDGLNVNNQKWLEWIQKQASKKSVKKIAVENFLMSVGNNPDEYSAKQNLWNDARSYKWNSATVETIYKGIEKYFREVRVN